MILGAILNLVTGLIVDKVPVVYIVLISSALGALAPLLMAINSPSWPYWYASFPAQVFEPLNPDGESEKREYPLIIIISSNIYRGYSPRLGSISRPDTSACGRSFQYGWPIWTSSWSCSHRRRFGFGDTEL